jgi:hypothetical protein
MKMDQDDALAKEVTKIDRTAFIEVMSRLLEHLKTRKLASSEFMEGMDACFKITTTDFRFGYDYLVENLITFAPQMTLGQYKEFAQTIHRMGSYMHRFEIVHAKLLTLWNVAEQQFAKCNPDIKID